MMMRSPESILDLFMLPCRKRLNLEALETRVVPTVVSEVEPNDTPSLANDVPIAVGNVLTAASDDWLTIQGVIGTVVDRDFYRFSVTQPAGVFLDLESRDVALSDSLDATIDVYNAAGTTLLGSNDQGYDFRHFAPPDSGVSSAASPDPFCYLDLEPGTYLVRVASRLSGSAGAYQLRLLADSTYSTTVPEFDSLTGATVSLYLDFDGQSGSDDWGVYTANAFNLTGANDVVSPAERLAIWNMWRVVAEDWRPFSVNVTTVAPASVGDGIAWQAVVTSSAATIVNLSANTRGAALPSSFAQSGSNIGFVFAPAFGDYGGGISGKLVAAALEEGNEVSRQFGVSLGLRNYGGTNPKPTGLMQNPDTGLNREIWSAGLTHSGEAPIVTQDDVAVITSSLNGIVYRPDDYGDTIASASNLTAAGASGFISSCMSDSDFFVFNAAQGDTTFRATVDGYTADLNLQLRVYNLAGVLLASADPDDSLSADLTVYLPALGNYILEVRSHGDPGEMGAYQVNYSTAPVTAPGAVTSALINGGAVQRSNVKDITVRFSRPMTFPNGPSGAISLTGPGGPVQMDFDLTQSTPSLTTVKLRFPSPTGGFGSVPDGNYLLVINANAVFDDGGSALDGDGNGQPGGNFTLTFHRLFGDFDGDRDVDILDFSLFRTVFGQSGQTGLPAACDSDGDGDVDIADFSRFRQRFGTMI